MKWPGTQPHRLVVRLQPIPNRSQQVEEDLGRREESERWPRREQQAAGKSHGQQHWREPAEDPMREEGKCQKAVARVEVIGVPKQCLIVAGANAHPASELRRQSWGYLFNRNCFGIVNHTMALKADLKRNLEVFYD